MVSNIPERGGELGLKLVANMAELTHARHGQLALDNAYANRRTRTFLSEETVAYTMPRERSYDIDTEDQLLFVSTLLARSRRGAAVDNGTAPPY